MASPVHVGTIPSIVDVRNQRPTTAEEIREWADEPGWARARRERFQHVSDGRTAMLANDDYLAGKIDRPKPVKMHTRPISPGELVERQLAANFRIMEQIRGRVDSEVDDPVTADLLKPYYTYGCKRPTFHDEFLPTFNLRHVHLVDTAPTGVREINERGIVHDGTQYDLDVVIYATGFAFLDSALLQVTTDENGRSIRARWDEEGTRTYLGIHVRGFPNLFLIGGPQGGPSGFNYTYRAEAQSDHIAWILDCMRDRSAVHVDVTAAAESEYVEHCRQADVATAHLRQCASYLNGYGKGEAGSLGYAGGNRWLQFAADARSNDGVFEFARQSREAANVLSEFDTSGQT